MMPININVIYDLTLQIMSVGILIGSFEGIFTSNYFGRGQPFDWQIVKPDKVVHGGRLFKILNSVYSQAGMIVIMSVRVLAVISVLFALQIHSLYAVSLLILTAVTLLIYNRHSYGMDGADQMTIVNLITIVICTVFNSSVSIKLIGIAFIGAQLALAYFSSGVAKLISPKWRNGFAAEGVLSTNTYGTNVTRNMVRYKPFACLICWFTIVFEVLFPFALLLDGRSILIWLTIGFVFHLSIAAIMGLNDFVWAFAAGYPAFYYLGAYILPRLLGTLV